MKLGKYLRDPGRIARKLRWRRVYDGERRDVTVESYNGILTFDSRDKLIGKYLYVDRAYERRYIEHALGLLKRDGYLRANAAGGEGVLLDVGANIGMICIALLKHDVCARAIAVEPSPRNLRLLEHNVAQNGLRDRVTIVPCALSSESGELELELSEYNSGDNRIRHDASRGAWGEDRRDVVRVPVRTLDETLADLALTPADIRLAWVDIQGHEGFFLRGARSALAAGIPVVSEFWPYGILRSGMSRADYVSTARAIFTHFYHMRGSGAEKLPIARLDALFDVYAAPKEMCEVILVNDGARG
jgi:FkbM family methyltransferase